MIVRLVCVGSIKGPLSEAAADYEDRVRRYWRMEVDEVPAGVGKSRKADASAVVASEEVRILGRISPESRVVALTREGREWSSRKLARTLQDWAVHSAPEATFVIGGAHGLGPGILEKADHLLSLSAFTYPHELARVVLLEQLYRAGTITRNEPYHKGP